MKDGGQPAPFARSMFLAGRCASLALEGVCPLDAGNVDREGLVPGRAAVGACPGMVGLGAPGADRFLIAPVGDGDAEPVGPADRVDAEEARLFSGQAEHLLGALRVAIVTVGPRRGED